MPGYLISKKHGVPQLSARLGGGHEAWILVSLLIEVLALRYFLTLCASLLALSLVIRIANPHLAPFNLIWYVREDGGCSNMEIISPPCHPHLVLGIWVARLGCQLS